MDAVMHYLSTLNIRSLLLFTLLLMAGSLVISAIGRFVFGKHSTLCLSVISAIDILFIYSLNIVLYCFGVSFIAPLPFVSLSGNTVSFFVFRGAELTAICQELVGLISLSFLMSLIERLMPKGKHFFGWLLLRVLTLIIGQAAFLAFNWAITTFLPASILAYAPAIVLAVLLLMLLTGSLKFLLGLFLTTIDPFIAVFYTFFFCNIIGKSITQAVISTAIISLLIFAMEKLGILMITIIPEALVIFIPLLLELLLLWWILKKIS